MRDSQQKCQRGDSDFYAEITLVSPGAMAALLDLLLEVLGVGERGVYNCYRVIGSAETGPKACSVLTN